NASYEASHARFEFSCFHQGLLNVLRRILDANAKATSQFALLHLGYAAGRSLLRFSNHTVTSHTLLFSFSRNDAAPIAHVRVGNCRGKWIFLGQADIREQTTCDLSCLEVFLRDRAGRQAISTIVAVNCINGRQGFFTRVECEKPFARGQDIAEAGVLGDHRFAAGQVTGVALTEPATPQPDVLVLGYSELSPGAAKIV